MMHLRVVILFFGSIGILWVVAKLCYLHVKRKRSNNECLEIFKAA